MLGIVALLYGGITYTKREKVLDIGPIEATTQTRETIPLPPVFGALAIVGGIALYSQWQGGRAAPSRQAWLPPLGGRLREAIHRLATATAFRLKPEATPVVELQTNTASSGWRRRTASASSGRWSSISKSAKSNPGPTVHPTSVYDPVVQSGLPSTGRDHLDGPPAGRPTRPRTCRVISLKPAAALTQLERISPRSSATPRRTRRGASG